LSRFVTASASCIVSPATNRRATRRARKNRDISARAQPAADRYSKNRRSIGHLYPSRKNAKIIGRGSGIGEYRGRPAL
jgi:hypothetical protein